jgi:Cu/Ag efflux protein CusF
MSPCAAKAAGWWTSVRDPAQLKTIKTGDHVEAVYTEAVALLVEPAK